MLIDTHCHIDVEAFDQDRNKVINKAIASGVEKIIVPAIKSDSWDNLLATCGQYQALYPALGLHPIFQDSHQESDLLLLEKYIKKQQAIAIGEIGLDFFIKNADRDKQQFYLEAQLKIAQRHKLPAILHVRKAHDQMLHTLQRIPVKTGICHAFNGSQQQAEQ